MANIVIKDGAGNTKYLKAAGAGTDIDPHVPEQVVTVTGCAPPYCVPRPVQNHAPVCRWWECPALHQAAF